MSDPTIPLKHAELLHVAMCTIIHTLEKRTEYPTTNMQQVVAAYTVSRDKHLKELGYTDADIKMFTEAAIDALVSWLEERHTKSRELDADFDRWARELLDKETE